MISSSASYDNFRSNVFQKTNAIKEIVLSSAKCSDSSEPSFAKISAAFSERLLKAERTHFWTFNDDE